MAADGTYLPANVSKESWIDTEAETELSMQSYLDRLDEELSKQPGFKRPPAKTIRKRRTTSKTDPDSGCINHGKKSGIGYLMETTVDCKYGIITGVDVYPANEKESLLVLRHLERQIQNGIPMQNIALDRGYDTSAITSRHGTTGKVPLQVLPAEELLPLPAQEIQDRYRWERRTVTREGLVSFDGIRYGVPWQYSGKEVQVRLCSGSLEIYYGEMLLVRHQVQYHTGKIIWLPGQYKGLAEHKGIAAPYPAAQQQDLQVEVRPLQFYDRLLGGSAHG